MGDTATISYKNQEIITTKGQSGSAIQYYDYDSKTDSMIYKILGVHVGSQGDNNFGTLIVKNMFLDFIIVTLERITQKHSGGEKAKEKYGKSIKELREKYKNDIQNREVERKNLEMKRQIAKTLEAERELELMNKQNYDRLKKER